MTTARSLTSYDATADRYAVSHARWLRYAGGEAQCAFEGAVTALLRPGIRLLDVACGTGTVARRLIDETPGVIDLTLLDASPRMLAQCQDIPANTVIGCMKDLPFEADAFDLLTCAWGIETLTDPRPALNEFVRVTRPGGHVCLVFCADRPSGSLVARALRHNVTQSGRGHFLSHDDLRSLAGMAGARHVQTLHCMGPAAAMIVHI
ncbi:MAG: methyltransferase domain-containing protein [Pseudomonadota bacterium]